MDLISESVGLYFTNISTHTAYTLFLTSMGTVLVLVIASPLVAVHKWWRRGTSDGDTSLPYLVGALNCYIWLRYSMLIEDYKMIAVQLYATALQTFYLSTVCYYRSRRNRVLRSATGLIIFVALLYWTVEGMSHESAVRLTGMLGSAVQIGAGCSCLVFLERALRTKSLDFLPFLPVAVTVFVELHAVAYGYIHADVYVFVANLIFLCMDGSLCAMFFIIPNGDKMSKQKVISHAARKTRYSDSPSPMEEGSIQHDHFTFSFNNNRHSPVTRSRSGRKRAVEEY